MFTEIHFVFLCMNMSHLSLTLFSHWNLLKQKKRNEQIIGTTTQIKVNEQFYLHKQSEQVMRSIHICMYWHIHWLSYRFNHLAIVLNARWNLLLLLLFLLVVVLLLNLQLSYCSWCCQKCKFMANNQLKAIMRIFLFFGFAFAFS